MDLIEAQYSSVSNSHHPWETARVSVIYELIKKSVPDIYKKEFLIADIGCGDIFLIEQLARLLPYAQFIAVDIAFTDEIISFIKQKQHNDRIRIYKSLADARTEGVNNFDLVLLLDVVEHVENEKLFFQNILDNVSITENTYFCITVPAFQSLFINRDIFLKHYRRYNKTTLFSTLNQNSLIPVSIGYFFFSLLPVRALQKMIEVFYRPDIENIKGIGGRNGNKAIDNIIKSTLIIDFKISEFFRKIGIILPGLSVFTIARYNK